MHNTCFLLLVGEGLIRQLERGVVHSQKIWGQFPKINTTSNIPIPHGASITFIYSPKF
jgi:hypothetical protein